jgi:hypothetical protein
MPKTYVIENLDNLLSEMCDKLNEEDLVPTARLAGIDIPALKLFWMEFAVLHLTNSCRVKVDELKSGHRVDADLFLDMYGNTLRACFAHFDFITLVQMKLGKYGAYCLLPILAELISPELKEYVLHELEAGARQMLEG